MATEKLLIDANALKKQKTILWDEALGYSECVLVENIDEAPTVDAVEVVHGRWKARPCYKPDRNGRSVKYCDLYYCSECGTGQPIVPPFNYCPNCGAKMDGDVNG